MKRFLLITGYLLSVSAMMSCGDRMIENGSTSFSSVDGSGIPGASTKPVAECTTGSSGSLSMSAQVVPGTNGSARLDMIRLKINTIPNEIIEENVRLAFFRWKAPTDSTVTIDSKQLGFAVYTNPQPGGQPQALTGFFDLASWAFLASVRSYLSDQTPASLFPRMHFLLDLKTNPSESDADTLSYKAIKVVLYRDLTAIYSADILIPAVFANPADYKIDPTTGQARALMLQGLHPFRGQTTGDFAQLAKGLCFM